MSRLGKSFKNRFLRRALAMVLAGTMVLSGMPVSFAAEQSDAKTSVEAEVQGGAENASEEAAEDGEVSQKESEKAETEEQESQKSDEELGTASEKESTAGDGSKEENTASDFSKETVVSSETEGSEESETDSEDAEESQTEEMENKANATHAATEGNSETLVKYNMEGFASSYKVTGGGLLKKGENDNYYTAANEKQFLDALAKVRKAKNTPSVIEITADMNLGNLELDKSLKDAGTSFDSYTSNPQVIKKDAETPLLHPTLLTTGVSDLMLQEIENLTIFSKNGSAIKHCDIIVKKSKNLIIRNITFDELWEWDEGGTDSNNKTCKAGDYDRNDWDYIGIEGSDGIWIDHCTFYKAYDGIVDIKNPNTTSNVTISWCRFLPESEGTFFKDMMDYLDQNKDKSDLKVPLTYYKELLGKGLSHNDIVHYAHGQKKTHLLGQDDDATDAKGINLTFANNYYFDSMDRMPRLRYGTVHEYNCVLDAQNLYDWKKANETLGDKITSNGAISTCEGKMLLENCYIKGINNPLISGNSDSPMGSINAVGSLYYIGDTKKDLAPKNNNSDDYIKKNCNGIRPEPMITNAKEFIEALPYTDYQKYKAESLNTNAADSVKSLAGAGKLENLSELQWEKTSYGSRTITDPEPTEPDNPPAETNGKEFRASSLETQAALTADLEVNEFYTITKGCGIAENKATINDIYFTKYIKLSTKGSKEYSIKVASPGKGTVTVYAAAGTTTARSAAGTLNLLDETGSTVVDSATDITNAASYTLEIPKKGVYYVASADTEIDVYGIDLTAEEDTGGDDKPTIEFSLRADELDVAADVTQLESVHTQNGFVIKAISANPMPIEVKNATITGIEGKITKCIRINKPGDAEKQSIHFTAEDTGTLTVLAASTNKDEDRAIVLYKKDGTSVSEQNALGSGATPLAYKIDEAGDYFIAPKAGVRIWYIAFSNKTVEPTPPDDDYAPEEVDAEWTTLPALTAESVYNADDAKDASKVMYNLEGYAGAANVTGGGLIKEGTKGYHKVTNEEEFLKALKEVQGKTNEPNVIEITTDLNLGKYELKKNNGIDVFAKGEGNGEYSGVIKAYTVQPSMHPTLKETGVSYLNMHGFQNLTIFSKNGATIKHAGMKFEDASTKNIIIRNIAFDELWEWDEGDTKNKPGDYDINDWDYMVIDEHAEGIWIDHCTFYKAYDGLIDIKNNSSDSNYYQRVTISWCEFLPGSKDNVFFNEQMKWLEDNINNDKENIAYYRQLRNEDMKAPNADKKMSAKDVWWYAYGQKKAHLFGSADSASEDKVMRVTLANNYYKNAMSRLPRLRFGKVHEYNCVFDSQQMNEQNNAGNPHITGNGAISACKGEMLLENNYIRGVRTPLRSGYSDKSDDTGYINFINGVYYIDGSLKQAAITGSSGGKKVTDEEKFKAKLPGGYVSTTRDATQLYSTVVPYAGAGKLDMTIVQWEATNYGTNDVGSETPASPSQTEPAIPSEYDKAPTTPWDNPENPDNPDNPPAETIAAPTVAPAAEMEFPSIGGEITLSCADGATIYYTISDTEAGLTDPADAENANRQSCATGTKIPIKKETYIWAVAVKDKNTSEPLKCHYTVAAEGEVLKPFATPDPAVPVASGTKVTLSSAGEFDAIYYATDAAVDLTQEKGGRETYNKETGIVITETVTIRAVAKKGDKYSSVATFTYTIKADADPDPDKTVASPVFSKAEGVVKKGDKITIDCATEGASIYYTTDGTEPKAEEQFLYTKGTEIVINQTTTIRAIAVKGENKSSESKATYTVEGTENPPVDPDEPEIKTIKLSECTITVPSIMESTKKGWKPQSVTYVTYQYKNENGETKHVKFAEGVDYDAKWMPEKQADGTYEVILTGRGRAADERSVDGFIIDKTSESAYYMVYAKPKKGDSTKIVDISKAKLSLKDVKNLYYTGYAHEPEIDYAKDKDGLNGKLNIAYRNNINAGKATVVISAKPGTDTETIKYVGSKTLTFTIKKAALNKDAAKATARVSIDEAASGDQQYMGGTVAAKGLKVETVVTAGEKKAVTLKKDEDYTVTYKNKAKDGAVTVTMTVKGVGNNLSGNCVKTFTIQQLDLKGVSFTEANGGKLAYSPSGKLGTITVMKDGNACTLKEGVDFAAKYEYDRVKKDAGSSVKVTITGKGVCKGTNTASFEIVQADFAKHIIVSEDAAVDKEELAKKGDKAFEKAFTVTDAAGTKFKAVKDYTITPDKTNKTITIKPNSTSKNAKNYTGEITFPYRVAINLAKDKNFIFNKDLEKKEPLAYDGRNPVRLTTADIDKYLNKNISASDPNYDKRTYRLGGKNANIEIVPGTYKNNAKKGTAQVTVRGVAGVDGGFYGQKVLKFKIVEK